MPMIRKEIPIEIINLLALGKFTDQRWISDAFWETKTRHGKKWHENMIVESFDNGHKYIFIIGRNADEPDWNVRCASPIEDIISIDTKNSQYAYSLEGMKMNATNGFQQIIDLRSGIPENRPKVLKEFARFVLEESADNLYV